MFESDSGCHLGLISELCFEHWRLQQQELHLQVPPPAYRDARVGPSQGFARLVMQCHNEAHSLRCCVIALRTPTATQPCTTQHVVVTLTWCSTSCSRVLTHRSSTSRTKQQQLKQRNRRL